MGGANGSAFEAAARQGRDSHLRGSAYLRYPFTVEKAAAVVTMVMEVLYEDGFIVYLNGHEVAASNAPAVPAFDSIATAGHVRPTPRGARAGSRPWKPPTR